MTQRRNRDEQGRRGNAQARVWAAQAERLLDLFAVRVFLSAAIISSLLPMPWMQRFDVIFLAIFGSEFTLRLFSFVTLPRMPTQAEHLGASDGESLEAETSERRRRVGSIVLLVIDFIALLSFLPAAVDADGARWLRIFRLTRMLLLFGYWAPLVRDLWGILARRERARQLVLMGFVVGGLSFAGAVLLYYLSDAPVDVNDDGLVDATDHSFMALLWWSFRQVQDPGNMLSSPTALPVVLISVMLTVFGLFLVSFLIGMGTDVVRELLELTRLRPPGLRGHTVVVNITPSTRRLLHELMRYYRKLLPTDARPLTRAWFRDLSRRGFYGPRYLIVGNGEDPPDFLRQPELSRIVYRQRGDDEEELIHRADLMLAKRIVLLADAHDSAPDAETIRTLVTLVERVREREQRSGQHGELGRRRAVIAEILDESHIPAAQAALATGSSFRGFVVPTEKLLALFFASVIRRPGLGTLLEELLTSRGHEIYTCFFRTPGLSSVMRRAPDLGRDPVAAVDALVQRGLQDRSDRARVVPLGLLVDQPAPRGGRDFTVWINPGPDAVAPSSRFRGFVGIAHNFGSIWSLAEELPRHPGEPAELREPDPTSMPVLRRTHRRKTTRVLVCGFRPGSVYMLEELFRSDPGGELLVIVESRAAKRRCLETLEAHSELVRRGLMAAHHGVFEPADDGLIHFRFDSGGDGPACRMHLHVADWMASRNLVDLPGGFGHVCDLDAIIFVASDPESADKRTTTALLKLEQLFAAAVPEGDGQLPHVVAEVIDGKLATRLERRCGELGLTNIRVFSIQELRAYFLFQSVVVPGFDTVYTELLGSWGQSFVHMDAPRGDPDGAQGSCSFVDLAVYLRKQGKLLVAVELEEAGVVRTHVAPDRDQRGSTIELSRLRGVWVIAPDSGRSRAGQRPPEPARADVAATEERAS